MSSEQEAILRFGIEIEKMLCEKLGKQWRPSGMSIESLVEEMSAKANAPSAYVHLPKDPDRFIALHPGDRLTIEARNPDPAVVRQLVDALRVAQSVMHGMEHDFAHLWIVDETPESLDLIEKKVAAALAAAREAGL